MRGLSSYFYTEGPPKIINALKMNHSYSNLPCGFLRLKYLKRIFKKITIFGILSELLKKK